MSEMKSSAANLYNNSVLSDVKIKQVKNGSVREYHSHKAILCKESKYFMKAFTGSFKEAADNAMELHDDEPDLFEFVLKFIYTENYDKSAIKKLAVKDRAKRTLIPVGLYAIADKYEIDRLYHVAAEDVKQNIKEGREEDYTALKAAIQCHYQTCASANGNMGKTITAAFLDHKPKFGPTEECSKLLQQFPVFGADMALEYHRRGIFSIQQVRQSVCAYCQTTNHVVAEGKYVDKGRVTVCAGCGDRGTF